MWGLSALRVIAPVKSVVRSCVLIPVNKTGRVHIQCLSTKMPTLSPPPQSLMKTMDFPQKLLMGPGPSNCPPRVLNASALPLLGHLHPEFTQVPT